MNYCVYHISISPELSSGYIGITNNPEIRFQQHKYRTNEHLKNAIKKYGDQVFKRILLANLDKELAELCEEMLRPNENIGWNIAKGGSIPPNPTGKQRSEQYRKNIAKAKQGHLNPMYGKKVVFSKEHREKLSIAKLGKPSALKNRKRPQKTCPHCNKTGGIGAMQRWHFDRCKNACK